MVNAVLSFLDLLELDLLDLLHEPVVDAVVVVVAALREFFPAAVFDAPFVVDELVELVVVVVTSLFTGTVAAAFNPPIIIAAAF